MKTISRAPGLDNTIRLLRDPYRFIAKTCWQLKCNCFKTRIFGRSTVCMTGAEAASLFYNPEFTIRKGTAPEPLKVTLLGKGAIQGMDGEDHKIRKQLFMSFMTQERIDILINHFKNELKIGSKEWAKQGQIVLYKEIQGVLTKSVCAWTGVPLKPNEISSRTEDLTAMFNSIAPSLAGHFRARWARIRTEIWISELIKEHRNGKGVFPQNSIADTFSKFKNENGEILSPKKAAIELINILRPVVAVSAFIVFTAHALAQHPELKEKLKSDPLFRFCFVQEVRRYYPFFPASVAKAKIDFEFNGHKISKGQQLMLDLYGTNHDSREWTAPDEFQPERFVTQKITPFNFIPQGGGDHFKNHRCPGEHPTLALMTAATEFFINNITYLVPKQNLELNFSRMPGVPQSGFVISNISFPQKPRPKRPREDTLSL